MDGLILPGTYYFVKYFSKAPWKVPHDELDFIVHELCRYFPEQVKGDVQIVREPGPVGAICRPAVSAVDEQVVVIGGDVQAEQIILAVPDFIPAFPHLVSFRRSHLFRQVCERLSFLF